MLNFTKPFFMWSHFDLAFQEQLHRKYTHISIANLRFCNTASTPTKRGKTKLHISPPKGFVFTVILFCVVFRVWIIFCPPFLPFFFKNTYCEVGEYLWERTKERVWIWKSSWDLTSGTNHMPCKLFRRLIHEGKHHDLDPLWNTKCRW